MFKSFYIILFFAVVLDASSCKNNDEVFAPNISAFTNVVNASADTLNFYLNGTRQNNSSSLYPGGQSFYLTVPSGTDNFQFKRAGTFNVLFSAPLTLKDSLNYSLYVTGVAAGNTFSSMDSLYTDTAQNTTQVRFVNASPDAGNLSAFVGDTINFKSRPFKSTSVFLVTGSGIKQVQVYQTGSANPLIDTPITFQPGAIYSLVSRGLLKGTGTAKFNISIITNVQ